MTYKQVNGPLFKKMVINGAINLKNHIKEIDDLNVFPVPDGDTGTNMSMTMMSGVRDIQASDSISIADISKTLSRGLLMGARGNSGVILSQFFRGIYLGLNNIKGSDATIDEFINCLVSGYQVAYKAVTTPVEGTILTVMRESGEKIDATRENFTNIKDVMTKYIEYANVSLQNTPNILPVLKDAGVVDSGGAGFLKVMTGMLMALEGNMLEMISTQDNVASNSQASFESFDTKDIKFGYCTEFILMLKNPEEFEESDLRSPLSIIGDSLVVVKDEDLVKIHVHTNNPGRVLNMAQRHGEFKTIKIENMRLQHTELINSENNKNEKSVTEKKKYALVAACFGDGIKDVFRDLGVDYIIDGGQTMNPSTEDFAKAVEALNAENVIIIPNNSNVIMAAEQTKKLCEGYNIEVLRTKTIAHGYASLMVFDETISLEENVANMTEAIKHVQVGETTYAVRDTKINGIDIKSGDFMGILNGEIIVSTEKRSDALKTLLENAVTEEAFIITVFYGLNVDLAEVDSLVEYAKTLNPGADVQVIDGKQDIYSYIIAVE